MSNEIRNLEPSIIWNNFCELNAVPRPSKKEEKVIKFMHDFGVSLGLETQIDKVGNVVIFKPATDGMENRKTVVLQSHLDMVHEKNNEVDFDFEKIRKTKRKNIGPLNNTYYHQYDDGQAFSFISKHLNRNHVLIGGGKFYGSDSDIANYYLSLKPVEFISQSINYFLLYSLLCLE